LRLDYQPPFDWASLLGFFRPRAIPGVEEVESGMYRRSLHLDGRAGLLEVRHLPAENQVQVDIAQALVGSLPMIVTRVRCMLDLDSDPAPIARHLSCDPELLPLVRAYPGLRVPGAFDGFEIAVRAILGQQVSVAAASTLAGRLVQQYGEPLDATGGEGVSRLFPRPEVLAEASLEKIGMPGKRRDTIRALAAALVQGKIELSVQNGLEDFIERLLELPGIGPWTAHYLALRLGEPDAFPSGDLGLRRAMTAEGEPLISEKRLLQRSLAWRPWRSYAAVYLWKK
jgi:AraC family transcriptional regulator of adaptative response / DNA-3-methyladenine glycosylase II